MDINLAADYASLTMIESGQSPTLLKLHKILYYVQAWHLALTSTPLLDEKFQAWVHGPVSPSLYNRYKTTKNMFSLITEEDIDINSLNSLDDDSRYHIDAVLESYGHLSGTQLEELTHQEMPWKKARGKAGKYERATRAISETDMANYYKRMAQPELPDEDESKKE
ncbi:MAG: type II toxin-antitoxin system antitoxin SocA domain-containing protein [Cyanobacteria bacterium J06623_5]